MLTVPTTRKNCHAFDAYMRQKGDAEKKRGIGFELTFAEWEWLWLASGKWEQRGYSAGQYCMARRGPDIGPYAAWNVDIKTREENLAEAVWQPWSDERRSAMSAVHKGKPKSEAQRRNMSAAQRARTHWPPTHVKPVEVEGVRHPTMLVAANALGVSVPTVRKRIKRGVKGYKYL